MEQIQDIEIIEVYKVDGSLLIKALFCVCGKIYRAESLITKRALEMEYAQDLISRVKKEVKEKAIRQFNLENDNFSLQV